MFAKLTDWFRRNVIGLVKDFRLSYMPPLMVYFAAGVSGLTAIVGTFFVKDFLDLSPAFLAMLGFWAGIPWALKMPMGHLVDLLWRWKSVFVFLGAALIGTSLLIMIGLLGYTDQMAHYMSLQSWFVLQALLAPTGYVVQDVVADAMTVEAVPTVDAHGHALPKRDVDLMHVTMQTLGRVAIVGGGIFVSLLNIWVFSGLPSGSESLTPDNMPVVINAYLHVYYMALAIPLVSVTGVVLGMILHRAQKRRLRREGYDDATIDKMLTPDEEENVRPNWLILIGSIVYVAFTLIMGLSDIPYNQEIIFLGSMGIVGFLMSRLFQELDSGLRKSLIATAVIIFVFRALPGPGAGASWWQIDVLGFDQMFIAQLGLIAALLALTGMFIFRTFMAEKSIPYIVAFLTIVGTVLTLPMVGMFYGLHDWTASLTHGVVDAHFIALIDTALESPLGQVAMIPMLAWIAQAAPQKLKATFFAVMASFTNLALSMSSLGTKYLNEIFVVTREVRDPITHAVTTQADYSQLGMLLIVVTVLSLVVPLVTIFICRRWIPKGN